MEVLANVHPRFRSLNIMMVAFSSNKPCEGRADPKHGLFIIKALDNQCTSLDRQSRVHRGIDRDARTCTGCSDGLSIRRGARWAEHPCPAMKVAPAQGADNLLQRSWQHYLCRETGAECEQGIRFVP